MTTFITGFTKTDKNLTEKDRLKNKNIELTAFMIVKKESYNVFVTEFLSEPVPDEWSERKSLPFVLMLSNNYASADSDDRQMIV